jgi:hypothetical protein
METKQYFSAMSAFCIQRSKMESEDELFWLTEAELLAELAVNAERQEISATRRTEQHLAA